MRPDDLRSAVTFVLAIAALLVSACDADTARSGRRLVETQAPGFDFAHANGMTGELYLAEIMGAGGAVIDYDGDGDLDLWAVQGGALTGNNLLSDRLYRNDLAASDGAQPLRFTDVTERLGVEASGYGMGATVGDFDLDGWPDIYLTNFGPNQLLRNRGDGTFEDVTSTSRTGDPRWSVGATFFDYDRDGWLDLYVANYVRFSIGSHRACFSPENRLDYCGPTSYEPAPDRLYRNRGDGTFEDVSSSAGIVGDSSNGLAVVTIDFNTDGWADLYVANDQTPNQLWLNSGDGRFVDAALWTGLALNAEGRSEASMGIAVEDFDGDADQDVMLTHIDRQSHTYYRNEGGDLFVDATIEAGLAAASTPVTGFGLLAMDLDGDGLQDVLGINGAVRTIEEQQIAGDTLPLRQRDQFFRNTGGGVFEDATAESGPYFERSEVGRGAVRGDLDNDGDMDAIIFNNNGPARLLLNTGAERPWIGVHIAGNAAAAEPLGTAFEIPSDGAYRRVRWLRRDGSYCSSNDARVLLAIDRPEAATVRLTAPGGSSTLWRSVPGRVYVRTQAEYLGVDG